MVGSRYLAALVAAFVLVAGLSFAEGGSEAAKTPDVLVRESMDRLVSAYMGRNSNDFMTLVSSNFAGESSKLDTRLRRDFSQAVNISLSYTFNNVTFDSKSEYASVAITYTKNYTEVKTTQQISKKGESKLVFKMEKGAYRLFRMDEPWFFSLK